MVPWAQQGQKGSCIRADKAQREKEACDEGLHHCMALERPSHPDLMPGSKIKAGIDPDAYLHYSLEFLFSKQTMLLANAVRKTPALK